MINSKLMKKFVAKVLTNLEGEWVIIGGTVLSLLGIDERVTMDIDMIAINNKHTNSQSIKLMEIADSLGLPVEAINQAGEYFLSKVDGFQDHLILFAESKKCKIYRPDAYLFLKLKLARSSETDISDCITFLRHNKKEAGTLKKDIHKLLKHSIKSASPEKQKRILEIEGLLNL
jgi:hypothetical protein